ncbi:MAG: PfkB family carbohydrate kinase [Chloroflexi bacterium]|nr:PfkB family carbohydrate kinase [Chloroflexota bacterium]
MGSAFRTAGAGKGANQAVAAARIGARVSLIGCLGDDANGRHLQTLLRQDDVDISRVRVVAEPTGVAMILVESADMQRNVPARNVQTKMDVVVNERRELLNAVRLNQHAGGTKLVERKAQVPRVLQDDRM